ncbi:MAG: TIGR02444 family protein [Gammaproteobacteria bacterium]|nr:MAG: TIGR02444 family protein [Gammaproteobacteria bacterium]
MTAPESHQSLWNFALGFYARQGVAETCLLLQDQHNANVCLLIGLHWLDTQRRTLAPEDWSDLVERTGHWTREIIEPLRKLRRTLKQELDDFEMDDLQDQIRQTIKQAELLAEKKLLEEIERWSLKILPSHQAFEPNLEKYLVNLGIDEGHINSLLKKLSV